MTREERQKAIDALKISAPVIAVTQEEFNDYIQTLNQVMDWLEQEPCEDAISRQAVLEGLASIAKAKAKSDSQKALMGRVMFFTEQLPPVTPQPKTGKWVNKSQRSGCGIVFVASECTCCGKKTPFNCDEFIYRYCPNCGAKMQEVEE